MNNNQQYFKNKLDNLEESSFYKNNKTFETFGKKDFENYLQESNTKLENDEKLNNLKEKNFELKENISKLSNYLEENKKSKNDIKNHLDIFTKENNKLDEYYTELENIYYSNLNNMKIKLNEKINEYKNNKNNFENLIRIKNDLNNKIQNK